VLSELVLLENWRRGDIGLHDLGSAHPHSGGGLVSIVLFSLASAASYGFAAVLQHHATAKEPSSEAMRMGLVVSLATRPGWLAGNALDGVGYLFQFLALRRGSLALVEPLLVLSLVVALPVAARLEHQLISPAALVSAGTIATGLGLFLWVARAGVGHPHASVTGWVVLSCVVAVFCVATVVASARSRSQCKTAMLLAGGSGVAFGYAAAVTERTGHLLDAGVLHTLTTWEPYALIVAGTVALFLTQGAFHAGALRLSLPALTVAQPLVAIAISLTLFGEHIDTGGAAPGFEFLGLALMVAGVFAVAQTPVIARLDDTPLIRHR
jgi:drug/metabolite transporter (DMT)-like permease